MMERYKNIFRETISLGKEFELETLRYQQIPAWDSVGHMDLVANLEEGYDIMFETDEIIGFDSFQKGIEILRAHGVQI